MSNFVAILLFLYYSELTQAIELKYALFTSSEGFDSSGAVPAIELAEDMINRNSSILPGYTLVHDEVRDTLCNRARSLDLFFEATSPPSPPLLGLIGCGCSVASTPVAEIIHHKSMSQVAYGSGSVQLDNGDQFPNFFRTHPSDTEFTPIFLSVLEKFEWKRVAFLTQNEGLFTGVYERLAEPLAARNVTVQNRIFSGEFPIEGINSKKFFFEDEDYRVFFVNTYSNVAQYIICEAYKRGYTYPKYAWITLGWYGDNWWTQSENPSMVDCTDSQLDKFLHRTLSILVFAVASHEDAATDTGLTEKQFNSRYRNLFNTNNYTVSYVGSIAYDALWSLAFALNNTSQMIDTMEPNEILNITGCSDRNQKTGVTWELVPLENFTNDNELMGCVIRWNLQRTDFIGVSGLVQFNEVGSRFQAHSQIFQYRSVANDATLQRVFIALTNYVNGTTVILYVANESIDTVFPDGIPLDGTPIPQINSFHLALVGIYYSLAVLGIVFSTVCLVFNFTQRKKKIIRLTSPNLNYFLIAGTYLMFLSVFCRLIPSDSYLANYARCILDVLVDTIGYCLAFGVVLAKMGRIYYIFTNPTSNKMAVRDWQLILFTLAVTGIGTLLVSLQVAVPLFRPDPQLISDPETGIIFNENGIRINNFVYACFPEGSQATTWIIVTFLYLGLLQVIGIVLAIQTRKVKVKVLNDSKYIAALIYISSIVLITRAVAVFALRHLLNVREVIFSGGILLISMAFLSLVFIPKMVSVLRDPNGEKIFEKTGETELTASMTLSGRKTSLVDEQVSRIMQLEAKIVQLEEQLEHSQQLEEQVDWKLTDDQMLNNSTTVLTEVTIQVM